MNADEIEQAVSALAEQAFLPAEFPYAFLQAFGNKETTLKRLRSGASKKSDVGGILQTNNIHIAVAPTGEVSKTLDALRASPATGKAKARFILATDGTDFEAEDLINGKTVASSYGDFPNHFGFFLPLAGITTVEQISENAFDMGRELMQRQRSLRPTRYVKGSRYLSCGLHSSRQATKLPSHTPPSSGRILQATMLE